MVNTQVSVNNTNPLIFADFTQGPNGNYFYSNTEYTSFAAWLTAANGTYTGPTSKYVTNSTGYIVPVTNLSATNMPWDCALGVAGYANAGLLLEGPANNQIYGNMFLNGPDWTSGSATIGSGYYGPDGQISAYQVVSGGVYDYDYYFNNSVTGTGVATGTGLNWTYSIYAKAGTNNWLMLTESNQFIALYNLSNGAVDITTYCGNNGYAAVDITDAFMIQLANGWYRCVLSYVSASYGGLMSFGAANAKSTITTGAGTYQVAYPQMEQGSSVSSVLLTANGLSNSRVADSLSFVPANNVGGVLYTEMNPVTVAQSGITVTSLVVSNNGLTVTDAGNTTQNTTNYYFAAYCLTGVTSGNYYFEWTADVFYNYTYGIGVGVANPAWTLEDYIGVQSLDSAGFILGSGGIAITNNTAASNIAGLGYPSGAVTTPQTYGIAMDVNAKQLWFNIANTWYPGNPSNTTGYNASAMPTPWYPVMSVQSEPPFTMSGTFNFGSYAYAFTPPTGFANLTTANTQTIYSGTFGYQANPNTTINATLSLDDGSNGNYISIGTGVNGPAEIIVGEGAVGLNVAPSGWSNTYSYYNKMAVSSNSTAYVSSINANTPSVGVVTGYPGTLSSIEVGSSRLANGTVGYYYGDIAQVGIWMTMANGSQLQLLTNAVPTGNVFNMSFNFNAIFKVPQR